MFRLASSDVSAVSGCVANARQTLHHVSCTPSKIPYVGFSPIRLQTGIPTRPSSIAPQLKLSTSIHRESRRLIRVQAPAPGPFGPFRACTAGPVDKGDPVQRSFAPQGVMLSHRVHATMTSSETLQAFRRLIFFVQADLCPTALSGLARRGSPICSACLFFRAAVRPYPGGHGDCI